MNKKQLAKIAAFKRAKLLPCPFCASEHLIISPIPMNGTWSINVSCCVCSCRTHHVTNYVSQLETNWNSRPKYDKEGKRIA